MKQSILSRHPSIASRRLSSGAHSRDPLHRNDAHAFAISRRDAPEPCMNLSPKNTEGVGNAGCPPHPQPRVRNKTKHTSIVAAVTPDSPGIPARNGFNGLFRALPGDQAFLSPSLTDKACRIPVGPTCLRKLDASVEASGPHDFAVRNNISRQHAL
jgi:hypothetical protein